MKHRKLIAAVLLLLLVSPAIAAGPSRVIYKNLKTVRTLVEAPPVGAYDLVVVTLDVDVPDPLGACVRVEVSQTGAPGSYYLVSETCWPSTPPGTYSSKTVNILLPVGGQFQYVQLVVRNNTSPNLSKTIQAAAPYGTHTHP